MRFRSRQRFGRFGWGWLFTACVAVLVLASAEVRAASVFVSVLGGESERPDPVLSGGAGSATAMLSGGVDSFVLSYALNYSGLGSDAVAGHIHYSILPPGSNPADQTGPVVHALDADFGLLGTTGTIMGEWRYDDAQMPLTNALADSLLDGELYFNLHSVTFGNGEIRGQITPVNGNPDGENGGTAIPLPPALLMGLLGLGAAGVAARRRKRKG
jgi:LPXTG-motif cell wall-anchored protein